MRTLPSSRTQLHLHGPEALSDAQLLSFILSPRPSPTPNDFSIGMLLMDRFRHPSRLDQASVGEICSVTGLSQQRAAKIKAALELGKRSLVPASLNPRMTNSREVAAYFLPRMANLAVEQFRCALLNTRNRLLKDSVVATGTVNACFIHTRDIFRPAIAESASAIILVHNHPSGDSAPSEEDIGLTRRARDAAAIIGVRIIDHVIVANTGHFSFLDSGLLQTQ